MKMFIRNEDGITLIALIITIIVLLILAGISINALSGENGLINRAVSAKAKMGLAEIKERIMLDISSHVIAELSKGKNVELTKAQIQSIIEEANSGSSNPYNVEFTENGIRTENGDIIPYSEVYKSVKDDNSSANPNSGNDSVTYTVTFNTNGGSNIASATVESGSKVSKPQSNPTNGNYTFVNWYSNQGLTQIFDFDNTTITSDITIYAKWSVDFFVDGNNYSVEPNTSWGSFIGEGKQISAYTFTVSDGTEEAVQSGRIYDIIGNTLATISPNINRNKSG